MSMNRRKVPGRRYHPDVLAFSPNIGIDLPNQAKPEQVQKSLEMLRARSLAMAQEMIHYGTDKVVDRVQTTVDPNLITGIKVGFDPLIAFTVPDSQILEITRIGVYYSEAAVAKCVDAVGWRVVVDDGRVSYISDPVDEYFYLSLGDVQRPSHLDHLWIQSGETISLELHTNTAFNEHITLTGRLSGRLYDPASSQAIF